MTVIATVITRHFTAHATDSFITVASPGALREVVEDQASKLVRVPAWRGAMAFWGLATLGADWDTKRWLQEQADSAGAYASPEAFASALASQLNVEWSRRSFARPTDAGLGVHFTAYEWIDGYWIPELFLVSNWTDTSYSAVRPGFLATRETYATLNRSPDRPANHGEPAFRRSVHAALHESPLIFRFNNGDPALFNPVADAIFDTFATLLRRGQVSDSESERTHLSLVRRPIEVVSKLLGDLAKPGTRLIGGRPHDLAIGPDGRYGSTTGD